MSDFAFAAPFGVEVIQEILPHRYPFLLIDRVTKMEDAHIEGTKNLTVNEPFFQGHFPGQPVYPGALQVESIAQLGAVWILSKRENLGKTAYLMTVELAKFRRPAVPGDSLKLEGNVTNLKSRTGRFVGRISVEDKVISEIVVTFAFQKHEAKSGRLAES